LSKATTQQPQRLGEVGAVLGLVAVAEDDVVVAVGQPGEYVEGGARDGPRPLSGDPGVGERLAGQPLVLGLHIDGGQHAVGAHAAQQPQARDTGAGADLHHGAGIEHRCQEPERGAGTGADRDHPDLLGTGACGGEDLVLGDVRLRKAPAGGGGRRELLAGHDAQPIPISPARSGTPGRESSLTCLRKPSGELPTV
jgi:hypothetical protein